MEQISFNVWAYIFIPIIAAALGGWVGAYFGNKYQQSHEDKKMKKVRNIAIKALEILKNYNKQSYVNAENQFNTDMTIAQKRTIIVLLHKLGVPVLVPVNESFDIHRIHFADKIIDNQEIEGIILQINQKQCDNLFFLDAENYFNANRQFIAIRELGKKYVRNVLAKSVYDINTHIVTYPNGWVACFGPGEYLAIRIFHEQACSDMIYDHNGNPVASKLDQMLNEIDKGLWDNCLWGNYEIYKNAKAQIEMSNAFQTAISQQQKLNKQ